jgi:hypothetical protein
VPHESGFTGELEEFLAVPDGKKGWTAVGVRARYRSGCLQSVEGAAIPHTIGRRGWTGELHKFKDLRGVDGRRLADVERWVWQDGQLMRTEVVDRGVEAPI